MEKVMKLISVSPMLQTEITRRDGQKKMLSYNEILLSDGIDAIFGETSENLTSQINSTDPNYRLELIQGALYSVRFNITTNEYDRDGKKRYFTKVNVHQLFRM